MKNLFTTVALSIAADAFGQNEYKEIISSIGLHLRSHNSIGMYGTWENANDRFLYLSTSLEK